MLWVHTEIGCEDVPGSCAGGKLRTDSQHALTRVPAGRGWVSSLALLQGGDRPAACTPLFSCGRFEASPAAPKRPSASTVQPVCSMRKGTQCHTSGHWPPELSQRASVKCRQRLGKDHSTWGAFSAAAAMAASRRGAAFSTAQLHQNACSDACKLPGRSLQAEVCFSVSVVALLLHL